MSSLLGTLTVMIGANTIGLAKAARDIRLLDRASQASFSSIGAQARTMNQAMLGFGRSMTQFVTLPLGILTTASSRMFSEFEFNLAKVTGLVGVAAEQTEAWGKDIQNMASDFGTGARKLSDALYFVTTGGIRGAETMDVMRVSARAAASGMGEIKDVADVIVSAMNAYGRANLSAAETADILTMSVREGKAEAGELVKAFGVVTPISSKLGVGFDEVGAGLAAMTRTGTTAATSATQLRRILFTLLKPTQQVEKALTQMGTSSQEMRDVFRFEGLLPGLMKINELTNKWGEDMMGQVFPNIRAFAGVVDILGENLEFNKQIFENIANSAGSLNRAFTTVSDTFKFKWNATMAEGGVLLIKFGEAIARILTPVLENLEDTFRDVGKWFEGLTDAQQNFIIKTAGITMALGPMSLLFAAVSTTVGALSKNYRFLVDGLNSIIHTQGNWAKSAQTVNSTLNNQSAATAANTAATAHNTTTTNAQSAAQNAQTAATAQQTAATNAQTSAFITQANALTYNVARYEKIIAAQNAMVGEIVYGTQVIQMSGIAWSNHAKMIDYNAIRYTLLTKVMGVAIGRYVATEAQINTLIGLMAASTEIIAINSVAWAGQAKALGYNEVRYARIINALNTLSGIIVTNTEIIALNSVAYSSQAKALEYNANRYWWRMYQVIMSLTNAVIANSEIIIANSIAWNNTGRMLEYNAVRYAKISRAISFANGTILESTGVITIANTAYDIQVARYDRMSKRYAFLVRVIAAGTPILNSANIQLGYNAARYAKVSRAVEILSAQVVKSNEIIAMSGIAWSNHARMLDYDASRYAAIMIAQQQHNKVLYISALALEQINLRYAVLYGTMEAARNQLVANTIALMANNIARATHIKMLGWDAERYAALIIMQRKTLEVMLLNSAALGENIFAVFEEVKARMLLSEQLAAQNALMAANSAAASQNTIILAATATKLNVVTKSYAAMGRSAGVALAGIMTWAKAHPILTLTALAAAIYLLIKRTDELTEVQKLQKELNEELGESLGSEMGKVQAFIKIAENERLALKMRGDAIRELNKLSPEYLSNLRLDTLNTQQAKEAIDAYTKSLEAKARMSIYTEQLTKLEQDYYKAIISGADKAVGWQKKLWVHLQNPNLINRFFGNTNAAEEYIEILKEAGEEQSKLNAQIYQEKSKLLNDALEDRSHILLSIQMDYIHVRNEMNKVQQLQSAINTLANEDKTPENIKKKAELEKQYQEVLGKTKINLESVMQSLLDEEQIIKNKVRTDLKLREYLEGVKAAQTKAESARYSKLYDERLTYLQNLSKQELAKMDVTKQALLQMIAIIAQLYTPPTTGINGLSEINEIFTDLRDTLLAIERMDKLDLFGDELEKNKDILKAYEKALKDIAEQKEAELSLNDKRVKQLLLERSVIEGTVIAMEELVKNRESQIDFAIDMGEIEAGKIIFDEVEQATLDYQASLAYLEVQAKKLGPAFDIVAERLKVYDKFIKLVENHIGPLTDAQKELFTSAVEGYRSSTIDSILIDHANNLADTKKKADLFGEAWDNVNIQMQLFRDTYNSLENMKNARMFNPADVIKYKEEIRKLKEEFIKLVPKDVANKINKLGLEAEMARGKFDLLNATMNMLKDTLIELNDLGIGEGDNVFDKYAESLEKLQKFSNLKEELASIGSSLREVTSALSDGEEGWAQWLNWIAGVLESMPDILGMFDNMVVAKQMDTLATEQQTQAEMTNAIATGANTVVKQTASTIEATDTAMTKANTTATNTNTAASIGNAAASVGETVADSAGAIASATKEGAKLPFPISIGAIAAGVAAVIGALATMPKAKKNATQSAKMKEGGIVPKGFPNDTFPAMLTSGEMVLPENRAKEVINVMEKQKAVKNKQIQDENIVFPKRQLNNLQNTVNSITDIEEGFNDKKNVIAKPIKLPKMATGGVVPPGYSNDTYPALLTSGEMVMPPDVLPQMEPQEIEVNVTVDGIIEGKDIHWIVKEVERRYKNSH